MRIAVVSDIHGNLTALEAVIADIERHQPDLVLHGGDMALMGVQPAEVVDRIRELGWPGIVGNTDEALWRPKAHQAQEALMPEQGDLLRLIFREYVPATRALLGGERIDWLRGLPIEQRIEDTVLVHATPDNLWRAPLPDADDDALSEAYAPLGVRSVVYGHIHRPYVRTLPHLVVANSGSVGMPFDGDPRASYLLLDGGQAKVLRVYYDVEREASLLTASGYPDAQRLAEMRRLGTFIAPSASGS